NIQRVVPKTLEILLMNFRGTVDVNSSARGQLGWGDSADGGFFTDAFVDQLESTFNNSAPDWATMINVSGQTANQRFLTMKQTELQKFSNFPALANSPAQASLRDSLQNSSAMTPGVFSLNVAGTR
ncbi:MAG: hypothetical protein AAF456_25715, partial [Planctomycetota bacterium]